MNTPVNPSFFYTKVGCKGVYITRTCLHDGNNRLPLVGGYPGPLVSD